MSKTYKRNLIKPLKLIIQVQLINVGIYLLSSILSKNFSINNCLYSLLPNNWFVILYIVLFIFSPYINVVLETLKLDQLKKLVLLSLLVFSVIPTLFDFVSDVFNLHLQLSPIGMHGNQDGYTIVNFALMYVVGAYLAKVDLNKIKRKYIIGLLLINIGIIFAFMYKFKDVALEYCNPFVISEAVLFFCLFAKLPIKENVFINEMAIEAFSVFLLHFYFYSFINIGDFVNRNPLVLLLHIVISSCVIYLLCWLLGFIYTKATTPIFTCISKKYPSLVWNIKNKDNSPESR